MRFGVHVKPAVRASIGFPPDVCKTLERIAQAKRVSVDRVVLGAAEENIQGRWVVAAEERRSL